MPDHSVVLSPELLAQTKASQRGGRVTSTGEESAISQQKTQMRGGRELRKRAGSELVQTAAKAKQPRREDSAQKKGDSSQHGRGSGKSRGNNAKGNIKGKVSEHGQGKRRGGGSAASASSTQKNVLKARKEQETQVTKAPAKVLPLKKFGRKIVDSEDDKTEGEDEAFHEGASDDEEQDSDMDTDDDNSEEEEEEEEEEINDENLLQETVFIPQEEDDDFAADFNHSNAFHRHPSSPASISSRPTSVPNSDQYDDVDMDTSSQVGLDGDIDAVIAMNGDGKGRNKKKMFGKRDQDFLNEVFLLTFSVIFILTGNQAPKVTASSQPLNMRPTTRIWPKYAQLVFPEKGKDIRLKEQSSIIGMVARDAITRTQVQCVTENAWPELKEKIRSTRSLLLQSATDLQAKDAQAKYIAERISVDLKFANALASLVTERLASFRKHIKDISLMELAVYELGTDEKCIARVQELISNDKFTFPGTWDENDWDSKTLTGTQASELIDHT
ncbi:hypothetical protein VKT23_008828 [Stygiomarasmius scandens]|uniref:DUF6532 domain-containing protein n=1 Tax=Marasmiellus scandens TaxID=2682957 RepID=A0ABR1JKA6_9AGAR